MAYSSIAVANELILKHPGDIDPLKLQKLLYFANGWWTAVKGTPLLVERPQVWRYGPVFQSIYRIFNKYGRQPIPGPEASSPFGGEAVRVQGAEAAEVSSLLDWIWSEYGSRSGAQLSDMTHEQGTPWREIAERSGFSVPLNTEIPTHDDWKFFSRLASERQFPTRPLATD